MKKVLLVDDSQVIRKVARRILESCELEVVEAADSETALLTCASAMPDAILVDWSDTGLDGINFLRELRKRPNGSSPKVIFCMTERDASRIALAKHAGADGFMMKPFDSHSLQMTFESVGIVNG